MKGKKNTATPPACGEGLTFEQAIERLEKIVADMEAAELPLNEVLTRYEEGTKLVRFCGLKLEEAEKKIELLTKKADGSVELGAFEVEETGTVEPGSAPADKPRPSDADENDAKLL